MKPLSAQEIFDLFKETFPTAEVNSYSISNFNRTEHCIDVNCKKDKKVLKNVEQLADRLVVPKGIVINISN